MTMYPTPREQTDSCLLHRDLAFQRNSPHAPPEAMIVIDGIVERTPIVPEGNAPFVPLEPTCKFRLDLMLKQVV